MFPNLRELYCYSVDGESIAACPQLVLLETFGQKSLTIFEKLPAATMQFLDCKFKLTSLTQNQMQSLMTHVSRLVHLKELVLNRELGGWTTTAEPSMDHLFDNFTQLKELVNRFLLKSESSLTQQSKASCDKIRDCLTFG